jgi:hypothetical protein
MPSSLPQFPRPRHHTPTFALQIQHSWFGGERKSASRCGPRLAACNCPGSCSGGSSALAHDGVFARGSRLARCAAWCLWE